MGKDPEQRLGCLDQWYEKIEKQVKSLPHFILHLVEKTQVKLFEPIVS